MSNVTMVTGAGGFIGAHIINQLSKRVTTVVAYDLFPPSGIRKSIAGDFTFVKGNVLDLANIMRTVKTHGIETIIHAARYAYSLTGFQEPSMVVKIDLEGVLNILEVARLADIKRVVQLSTNSVYGPKQSEIIDEVNHPKWPREPYGTCKLAAELLGQNFYHLYGVDFVAVRFSSVYGPGIWPGGGDYVGQIVEDFLHGRPTNIPAGGDHSLEHVHVEDAANGVALAHDADKARLKTRAYNISSGEYLKVSKIVEIARTLLPGATISIGPGLQEHEARGEASEGPYNLERAKQEIGYTPRYTLKKGIPRYIEEYKKLAGSLG